MSRKARTLRRNMLVVCEGSVTEPEYFAVLRRIALENEVWEEIEIRPKPRSDVEQEDTTPPHKSPRQKRQLKVVPLPEEADEIERQYTWRQTPANFVKEARDGLKDDTFEEAWAVFDRNGHPAHGHAFSLAREPVNGKTVNIAFSSIAFEHWILLHFERNATEFVKSECKDQEGHYLECGSGLHADDCWGVRCVSGYLRVNQYLTGSTKIRNDDFQDFFNRLVEAEYREKAYENAAWLRYTVPHNEIEPYLSNPYTNVDALVKRLLGEDHQTIDWANLGQTIEWQSLQIQVDAENDSFKLTIENMGPVTRLLNGYDIGVFSKRNAQTEEWRPVETTNGVINAGATKSYYLEPADGFQDTILEIKTGNHRLLFEI
ncbi:MAG: RloB domain-containing protein [Saprospiraceae bacterium]|nr:RloB domain-containing protein [Saprospiraceae bacterium]